MGIAFYTNDMQTPKPVISGILLAAGLSTRMGTPKQLLPFGESTIVETVVDSMLGAKLDEVIVVTGHHGEQIQEKLGTRRIKTVFNPHYPEGMLTSAQAGIRSLNEISDAFALMLVDEPFISVALIDSIIDAYNETEKSIALPSHNNRRGHPVIFHRRYAKEILGLEMDSGGVRTLFKRYGADIHYVIVNTDKVLRDIDYPEDYEQAIQENR